jgi:hypothetical protein
MISVACSLSLGFFMPCKAGLDAFCFPSPWLALVYSVLAFCALSSFALFVCLSLDRPIHVPEGRNRG